MRLGGSSPGKVLGDSWLLTMSTSQENETVPDERAMLSVVMPVYNEGPTLEEAIKALGAVSFPVPWELIICDDGSTDGATDAIRRGWVPEALRIRMIRARRNLGKGAALRAGFALAEGAILGVHDADLEYDPGEIPSLLEPILEDKADVVFGSREFGAHSAYSYWYVVGNRVVSNAACALFNRYITDAYTCYKFFTRDVYDRLHLTASGFEIEAELTGGLLRTGARVWERPITYAARTRAQGKKIRAIDGVRGFVRLIRVRVRGY
jgi:dolichol-phosphate hexosyltransferase